MKKIRVFGFAILHSLNKIILDNTGIDMETVKNDLRDKQEVVVQRR